MPVLASCDLVSVEEYLEGERHSEIKHEYLGGVAHAMAGGPTRHNTICVNGLVTLANKLSSSKCRPFNSDMKVRLSYRGQTRFYCPDLHVTCESTNGDSDFQDKPTVIIEVLSPSTQRFDLNEKLDAYLTIPSLQTLILLDQDRPLARVDQRHSEKEFRQTFYQKLDEVIDLPSLEISMTLSDLYQGAF